MDQSTEYKFLDDQTVFKGTARYDGLPVIAEGFVVLGINSTSPSTSLSFAADTANTVQGIVLSKSSATVASGSTVTIKASTMPIDGTVTWTTSASTYATVDGNGKVTGVAQGSAVITASAGNATAVCNVTVTSE
ncbi:MAG: Ig domain-containing protein [Lachnospiraceae bacterium]|nr:Ig domain-containing protein [Lachnospiraceae bacterium]